ncbi:glycosyltransferase [Aneurinibacillus sp. BA2021]|nr:glycosyltransferase [Aneurinibacillus sp. BA2021]
MADIGIVMPVYYQNPDHLRMAIQTVLDQSYRNFRFTIVVDGAPEMIPLIQACVQGDERVRLLFYKQNHGVAHALNIGFAQVMEDPNIQYVTWVSSDNVHYPHMLEVMRREIMQCPPEVGIVYSSFHRILPDGTPAHGSDFLQELHQWQNQPRERLLSHCTIGPAFLHRASFCRMVGDYRFTLVQDYDYWLRMTDYCDIRYIPEQLMAYRVESKFSLTTQARQTKEKEAFLWKEMHMAQAEAKRRRRKGHSPFVDASDAWRMTQVTDVPLTGPAPSAEHTVLEEEAEASPFVSLLTVLYFIEDTSAATLDAFFRWYPVLAQAGSVRLLSASPHGGAGRLISMVQERFGEAVPVRDMPYASMYTAVRSVIDEVATAYTLIVRTPGMTADWSWVPEAVMRHEQEGSRIHAVVHRKNRLQIEEKPGSLLHAGYVYRTEYVRHTVRK